MNRFRIVYCLLGWLACLHGHAAEPATIRYEGYEERYIRVYFEYAGDGTDRIVQPPPAEIKEKDIALLFQTYDDNGAMGRMWIWPNTYFLGYYVTTEVIAGKRFAIFKGADPYGSAQRIALNRESNVHITTGYFGMDDRGDSLVRVSRGDVFRLNGIDYAVQALTRAEAVLREAKTEQETRLPLSPLGEMRRENLKLRRELEELRRDYRGSRYWESTPILVACGAMSFFFLACYACIFLGLSTLEEQKPKSRKR